MGEERFGKGFKYIVSYTFRFIRSEISHIDNIGVIYVQNNCSGIKRNEGNASQT